MIFLSLRDTADTENSLKIRAQLRSDFRYCTIHCKPPQASSFPLLTVENIMLSVEQKE